MGGLLVNKQLESESGYIPLPRPMFVPERLDKVHKSKNIDELKLQYIKSLSCYVKAIILRLRSWCHRLIVKLIQICMER